LKRLTEQKDWTHYDRNRYFITRLGQKEVEARHLVAPTA
jgi:hypothetical protein